MRSDTPFTRADLCARARADLRLGLPVRIAAPGGDGGLLVLAASVVEDRWLQALRETAADGVALAISRHRAETLSVRVYDGDVALVPLGAGVDARQLRAMADPSRDLAEPLKGPFPSLRGSGAQDARQAIQLVRESSLLPAAVIARSAKPMQDWVRTCTACEVAEMKSGAPELTARAKLPVRGAPDTSAYMYRDPVSGDEHLALVVGSPQRGEPPLARVHSSCMTGDLLGSLRCDCGEQLAAALAEMARLGAGVLVVLQQEGRGIGLANKMRAYQLQDLGYDTYEANRRMGFAEDHRDFATAAAILRGLGHASVRLLTSNPEKARALERAGVEIAECIPLDVEGNPHSAAYLEAKARRHSEQ